MKASGVGFLMLLLGTAALASADRTVPTRAEIDASVQAAVAAAGGKIPTPQEIDTILKAALAAGLKSIPTPQEIDAFIKASTGRRSMLQGGSIPTPAEIDASIKVANAQATGLPTPQEIDATIHKRRAMLEGEKIPTPTEIDASIKVASAKAAGLPTPQEIDSAIAAGRRSMRTVPTPEETETLVQAALAAGVKPMPNPADVNALVSKVKEASASGRRSMLGCDMREDCSAWGPSMCGIPGVGTLCPCMCGGGDSPASSTADAPVVVTTATNDVPVAEEGGACGPKVARCPGTQCCSQYGYCGITPGHCGVGCQSPYGRCN